MIADKLKQNKSLTLQVIGSKINDRNTIYIFFDRELMVRVSLALIRLVLASIPNQRNFQ